MVESCITKDYKDLLAGLIEKDTRKELMLAMVEVIPVCTQPAPAAVKTVVERASAARWPDANYYDKDGSVKTGSFSGLFREIYGVPVTEDLVCRTWGDKQECRSPSTVENFRNRGDIVKGNGEEAPVPASNMSSGQIEKLYGDWKNRLLSANMKINIFHPESPVIKEATKTVEKTAKKR